MIAPKLAEFVFQLTYKNIPVAVQKKAKQTIADYIGNALSGSCCEEGEMALRLVGQSGSGKQATVIGHGLYGLERAAMVNAILSRVIDLDDGHKYSTGHPSTVIIPTAMAIAEAYSLNGKKVIEAVVGGYEVYVRIARGINVSAHKEKGYDMTGVCGSVAAAATAAKLLGYTETQISSAMGIAGSYTGGLYECLTDNSSPKILVPGWAVHTGIIACQMVEVGFTGPSSIIEGKKGLAQGVTNHCNLEDILDELGQRYEIMGTYFKKYACMRGLHGGIDAVLSIRDENHLKADDINCIIIHTSTVTKQYDKPFPTSLVATQSNLPFSIAVGLLYPRIGIDEILAALNNLRIKNLFERISIVVDAEIDAHVKKNFGELTAVRAEVRKKDGNIYEKSVYLASGEPENPFSNKDIEDKFFYLAGKAISEKNSRQIYQFVNRLEEIEDIGVISVLTNVR